MRNSKTGVSSRLPDPEKLVKQGKYQEAAELFQQKANDSKNSFERRRFLDSAARCYEIIGEYASSIQCYLEVENFDAVINVCMKCKNPKYLTQSISHQMKKKIVRALIICSINFFRERNFVDAQIFCEEALSLDGGSQLLEAFINILFGSKEYDQERIIEGLRIIRDIANDDVDLVSEIAFISKNFLSEIPQTQNSQILKEEKKQKDLFCSHCGAPFPKNKIYSNIVQCEYCGYTSKF